MYASTHPPRDYSLSFLSKLTLLIFKTGTVINSLMNTEKSVVAMKLLLVEIDWVITVLGNTGKKGNGDLLSAMNIYCLTSIANGSE